MGRVFTITEGLENMGALKTGGQGSVYKGRRLGTILTAIKLLPTPIHSESIADKNFADFQNEVEKLKKVSEEPNPNVVKILRSGITETGNLPFIEMEFIEGPDLEELLRPPRPRLFSLKEITKLCEQLSNALAHCHRLGIRHGDIKSNNVKLNVHTGNYVLLDFGLAVMSDEQRRTSLRHAGAVEFMAPEQTEGKLLFETDIYSFGIILYELLTGAVPFPLLNGGEMARNRVMLAHIESQVPDIIDKRTAAMPEAWTLEKVAYEKAVPAWLLQTVYKCLEKKPEARFANGAALQHFILANHETATPQPALNEKTQDANLQNLHQQLRALQNEKEELEKQVALQSRTAAISAAEIAALKNTLASRDADIKKQNGQALPKNAASVATPRKRPILPFALFFIMLTIGVILAFAIFDRRSQNRSNANPATAKTVAEPTPQKAVKEVIQNRNVGQFRVLADRAYFHNEPDEATRRNAYLLAADGALIAGWDVRNNFIYTEFTNSRGQVSKGWLRRSDLVTEEEWQRSQPAEIPEAEQLQESRALLRQDRTAEAAAMYKKLADKDVPEALFEYSNLALHNKVDDVSCEEAFDLLKRASDKGYAPAKRTLGFLYLFAENEQVMQISNYDRCPFEKNVPRGSRLLMEAVVAGDTAAGKWLQLHKDEEQQN